MAKEDKYILWAIALPVVAMLAIGFDLLKPLPQAMASALLLALLVPSPILVYAAKKKVFTPTPKSKRAASPTAKQALVENSAKKQLRNIAIVLQIIGVPLVIAGWQILRNTNRVIYYVLGGLMLLVGAVLVGASVGILKAANE